MVGIVVRTVAFFVVLLVLFATFGGAGSVELGLALVLAVAAAVGWRWLPTRK